jgi:hypothetical protein
MLCAGLFREVQRETSRGCPIPLCKVFTFVLGDFPLFFPPQKSRTCKRRKQQRILVLIGVFLYCGFAVSTAMNLEISIKCEEFVDWLKTVAFSRVS